MNLFDAKDPLEVVVLAFDFAAELGAETISAVTSVTASVLAGADPSPASMLSGAPAIGGATVTQTIQGGVAGVDYKLKAQISTSGGRVLVLSGLLPMRVL
ncbi:MAG: hypothetical protein ACOYZ7_08990 [Chloroflexota bacterium]